MSSDREAEAVSYPRIVAAIDEDLITIARVRQELSKLCPNDKARVLRYILETTETG